MPILTTGAGKFPAIGGGGGGPTQVRVTFTAPVGGANLVLDHVAIGVQAPPGDPYDTAATPVELLFSGASGFNITTGTSITSDWANLVISTSTGTVYSRTLTTNEGGWGSQFAVRGVHGPITGSSTPVVIIQDLQGADLRYVSGGGSDAAYYKSVGAGFSYNVANESGFSSLGGLCYSVTLIETQ